MSNMVKRVTLTLATFALMLAGIGQGTVTADVTLTTNQGSGADAYVQNGNADDDNFGSSITLRMKNGGTSSPNFHRKSYIRFDLASLANLAVAAANLELTIDTADANTPTDAIYTFNVFGLEDSNAGEDWSESDITWNNAPANDTNSGSDLTSDAVLLGRFDIEGAGTPGTTFTALEGANLVDFLNSDTNNLATFILTREDPQTGVSNNIVHRFRSGEFGSGSSGPQLDVTAVPEPSSFILGLASVVPIAAVGYFRRRRRAGAAAI